MDMTLGISTLMIAVTLTASATPAPPAALQREVSAWIESQLITQVEDGVAATAKGLRRSPGSLNIVPLSAYDAPPAIKQRIADGIASRAAGTLDVAAGTLPSTAKVIGNLRGRGMSDEDLARQLSAAPVDLSGTPLGTAERLGAEPNGALIDGRWTGVSRVFRIAGIGLIVLAEDDYHASGTQITLIREMLNATVSGVPARAYSARAADGRSTSSLRWVTPRRSCFLTLISDDGTDIAAGERLLLQIANGLPAST